MSVVEECRGDHPSFSTTDRRVEDGHKTQDSTLSVCVPHDGVPSGFGERLEELIEIGLGDFDEDSHGASDADRHVAASVGPELRRQPTHVGVHVRIGFSQGIEHDAHGAAELRRHPRLILRHLYRRLEIHQIAARRKHTGGHDPFDLHELIERCHGAPRFLAAAAVCFDGHVRLN